MVVFPQSKINLGLYVTGKRDDGFHSIESVFLRVPLEDILEVLEVPSNENSESYQFQSSGFPIPGDVGKNLVIKTYLLLKEAFSLPPVSIFLHKAIPMGAGLGGGSSDGAAMLQLLDKQFSLGMSESQLLKFAANLGSDCPFFIKKSACYVTGRGEVLEDFPVNLSGYTIVLVNPGIHVSTAEAFGMVIPTEGRKDIRFILQQPVSSWKSLLVNDFEKPVSLKYPEISVIKSELYHQGAQYASMTGSGSTVFGLFEGEPEGLKFPENYFVWKKRLD